MKLLSKFLLLALLLTASVSCSDDDDAPVLPPSGDPTIADLVTENSQFSSLLAALERADLVTPFVGGSGQLTVFAPNNDAFAAFLQANGYSSLDEVPVDALRAVLLNHVVSRRLLAADLSTGYVSSISPAGVSEENLSLFVDTSSGVRVNGVSSVIAADIQATNGVIHEVDAVIGLPTVATFAQADPEFSSLLAALQYTGLDANLADDAVEYTVFAPTNDAFSTFLGSNSLQDLSVPDVTQVLLNHVLNDISFSGDLSTSYTNSLATYGNTNNNLSFYINVDNGVVLNGISSVTTADIVAVNGVVHKVDGVIDLPTVVTFATADPNFSSLVAALTDPSQSSQNYVSTLSTPNGTSPAPFTVFAPTNNAFTDLFAELNVNGISDIPASTLTAALNTHVIAGSNVRSGDLMNGTVSTLGANIVVDASAGTLTDPNNRISTILVFDVQAANGVIHAIDRVLLP